MKNDEIIISLLFLKQQWEINIIIIFEELIDTKLKIWVILVKSAIDKAAHSSIDVIDTILVGHEYKHKLNMQTGLIYNPTSIYNIYQPLKLDKNVKAASSGHELITRWSAIAYKTNESYCKLDSINIKQHHARVRRPTWEDGQASRYGILLLSIVL